MQLLSDAVKQQASKLHERSKRGPRNGVISCLKHIAQHVTQTRSPHPGSLGVQPSLVTTITPAQPASCRSRCRRPRERGGPRG